jgi:hypothetical protein
MVYACQPDERAMPIAQFETLFTNFGSVVYFVLEDPTSLSGQLY